MRDWIKVDIFHFSISNILYHKFKTYLKDINAK